MKRIVILLLFYTLFVQTSDAKYVQTCKVKYKTNYNWSEYYTVEVSFFTGYELNRATRTYNYDTYSVYAIIFWDKDEATVIKVSSYTGCGNEVTQSCISNKVNNLEGEDQQGRNWELCIKNYCY